MAEYATGCADGDAVRLARHAARRDTPRAHRAQAVADGRGAASTSSGRSARLAGPSAPVSPSAPPSAPSTLVNARSTSADAASSRLPPRKLHCHARVHSRCNAARGGAPQAGGGAPATRPASLPERLEGVVQEELGQRHPADLEPRNFQQRRLPVAVLRPRAPPEHDFLWQPPRIVFQL